MLDNRFALLFIRGERPVKDLKYDILKHPNVRRTVDGISAAYVHGKTDKAVGTILFPDSLERFEEIDAIANEGGSAYELLSEEDVEQLYESNQRR
jgi:type IV secretion system protein VirD4